MINYPLKTQNYPVILRSVASSAIFLCMFNTCAAANLADLEKIRNAIVANQTGAQADPADSKVAISLAFINYNADIAMKSMAQNGSWPDINYATLPGVDWPLAGHYNRISAMVTAYRTPNQSLFQSEHAATATLRALSYIQTKIYEGCPKPGNWWWYRIWTPGSLANTLLMAEDLVPSATLRDSCQTLHYLMGESPTGTGQNLIWEARNHLYLAILEGETARALAARNVYAAQCAVQNGEGVQEDYSFHQHGAQLYNGGYGIDFGEDMARYVLYTNGTSFAIPPQNLDLLYHYMLDGSLWSIYRNFYDPSCRSRYISRGNAVSISMPLSLLVLSNVSHARKEEAIAALKSIYKGNSNYGVPTAPLWANVKDTSVNPSELIGHKHFHRSDYTVHRRPDYFASLKMLSKRVVSAENTNQEGLKGWHLSDGLLWVVLTGNEYVANNVLPCLDWLRLPGTTVERKALGAGAGMGYGVKSFVGGAYANGCGVSAMDFDANESLLTAQKSWFFFDEEIVCLGTSIQCPTGNFTETIVNQWPLASQTAPLTVDGVLKPAEMPWTEVIPAVRWAHCENMGYYFPPESPATQTLTVCKAVQSGSWRNLSASQSTTSHSKPILTLYYNHGQQATDESYAYAIIPGKTAQQMAHYAEAPPFQVLAQTEVVHAVRHQATGALGIVFWKAGALGSLQTSHPCILYCEPSASTMTLAITEPTGQLSQIQIRIAERLYFSHRQPEIRLERTDSETILTLQPTRGRNYTVFLNRTAAAAVRDY